MKKTLSLLMVLFLSIILVACDEGTSDSGDKNNDEKKSEEKEEEKALSIGDTAEFKETKFTLKSVTTTDERNEFADTDPEQVVVIEYELENTGDDDIAYGADITVYDADGNQMDTYPLDNSLGSVAPGKKVQGKEAHGIDSVGTIEIHYAPLISFEDAAVFEVEID